MPYKPIENYGLIGDLHSTALVSTDGSIDWFCFPRFDSPSVFGAILDDQKGGRFQIHPRDVGDLTYKQLYWPDTNVLITRFLSESGVAETVDFMPIGESARKLGVNPIIRMVTVTRGRMKFRMVCDPAFNYARDPHQIEIDQQGARFLSKNLRMSLNSRVPLEERGGAAVCDFELDENNSVVFTLAGLEGDHYPPPLSREHADQFFKETVNFWRNWLRHCTYKGRWRESVMRSALVLKLLTYEPTGAIVAAPTCSLPEGIGGERNWDYRYTWIRDAAFTLYGLLRIGFSEEAGNFMNWIAARCHELTPDGALQIMYGIDGRRELPEDTLTHLEGYRGSNPVRVGNAASNQLQLDIYGELMDSVYLYNKHGSPISSELWEQLHKLIDWVCYNWRRTDEGIWEVRSGQQHFVYSKLMCWVAIDRAIRLADKRSFPADRERWLRERDAIFRDIHARGWNEERQAFVQYYGSDTLDASNLMMPLVFFLAPSDPRMLKTLDATLKGPEQGGLVSNSLVFRYNVEQSSDGLQGEEGTFNICTFWLVEALTRAGRNDRKRLEEARLIFERMLGYGNHVGLFAEETGPRGEALGNFPQAFTHLALISAAYNLDKALDGGR